MAEGCRPARLRRASLPEALVKAGRWPGEANARGGPRGCAAAIQQTHDGGVLSVSNGPAGAVTPSRSRDQGARGAGMAQRPRQGQTFSRSQSCERGTVRLGAATAPPRCHPERGRLPERTREGAPARSCQPSLSRRPLHGRGAPSSPRGTALRRRSTRCRHVRRSRRGRSYAITRPRSCPPISPGTAWGVRPAYRGPLQLLLRRQGPPLAAGKHTTTCFRGHVVVWWWRGRGLAGRRFFQGVRRRALPVGAAGKHTTTWFRGHVVVCLCRGLRAARALKNRRFL